MDDYRRKKIKGRKKREERKGSGRPGDKGGKEGKMTEGRGIRKTGKWREN